MLNFPGIISVDLTKKGEVKYTVPKANRLWLAKNVCILGKIYNQVADVDAAQIAVRIQDRAADQLPFSLQDGFVTGVVAEFDTLYIEVITEGNYTDGVMYLNTGNCVAGEYASTDGIARTFGVV